METLFEQLKKINKIPMHMPGHKRNSKAFSYLEGVADIDITEIDGFDNLHNANGVLKESMDIAAKMRGAKRAFYLVNGSTCGILAGICAMVKSGEKVIMARNCHKSVYNAVEISGAKPIFVYPTIINGIFGSLEKEKIKAAIENNPDAKLVILTSPTYEGVVSNIEEICKIAHEKGISVLVDAAHGAHFGYSSFPKSAASGADICVESLHKTLPSLTQTAICYCNGDLVDDDKIAEKLSVFETSSPSYILLSSIDGCVDFVQKNSQMFDDWYKNLIEFYEKSKSLKNLKLLENDNGQFFDFDVSKIVIFTGSENRSLFVNRLRDAGFEPEMVSNEYVVLMTGLGDTKETFIKLFDFLSYSDKELAGKNQEKAVYNFSTKSAMNIQDARQKESEFLKISECIGKICGGYIWAYPPGVPLLVPGEIITNNILDYIFYCEKNDLSLCGDIKNDKILVIK